MLSYPVSEGDIKRPSYFIHLSEIPRTIFEFFRSLIFRVGYKSSSEKKNQAILVLPGFLGNDVLTSSLRKFLNKLGYEAHPWDLGVNWGDTHPYLEYLTKKIDKLHTETGTKIIVIGWSLGGIYGRHLAKMFPDKVESVITICSPFKLSNEPNFATGAIDFVAKVKGIPPIDPELFARMPVAPDMPTTSIFTKTDGIVPWQTCLETVSDLHKNSEVECGHIAAIYNKDVYNAIADVLA